VIHEFITESYESLDELDQELVNLEQDTTPEREIGRRRRHSGADRHDSGQLPA